MFGIIGVWNRGLVGWGIAIAALGIFYFVAWRQYRSGRARPRFDRHRERQRREYWGWE